MPEPVTDGDDYAAHRQLAVVDVVTPISHSIVNSDSSSITPFSSEFALPDGWFVQKVPRSDGFRFDKYYIEPETRRKFRSTREVKRYLNVEEYKASRSRPLRLSKYFHDPETGRKFRSMKEVERCLTEGCTPTRLRAKRLKYHKKHLQSCGSQKNIVSKGKVLNFDGDNYDQYQLVNVSPTSIPSTSRFKLPEGWIIEEVPRRTGSHIDRYYYEPGTGQRFRSLVAVQKHLSELEENSPLSVVLEELRENNLPLSKAFKLNDSIKNHGSYDSWKKSISRKDQDSLFSHPPSKIKWVISSSGGDTWNAFSGDTLVSDAVKQQWGKRFMSAINNTKHNDEISG